MMFSIVGSEVLFFVDIVVVVLVVVFWFDDFFALFCRLVIAFFMVVIGVETDDDWVEVDCGVVGVLIFPLCISCVCRLLP